MDDFGIGAAVLGAYRSVMLAMRGTGRTTRLLERYQEGDRIVFVDERQASLAERKAADMGKRIRWIVVDPAEPHKLMHDAPSKGRTHFDHVWLERFYELQIERATQDVRKMQDEVSGFGEPHRQTREAARMISQFRI